MKQALKLLTVFLLIGTLNLNTVAEASTLTVDTEETTLQAPAPYVDIDRYYGANIGPSVSASVVRDGHVYRGTLYYQGIVGGSYRYSGRLYFTPIVPSGVQTVDY